MAAPAFQADRRKKEKKVQKASNICLLRKLPEATSQFHLQPTGQNTDAELHPYEKSGVLSLQKEKRTNNGK